MSEIKLGIPPAYVITHGANETLELTIGIQGPPGPPGQQGAQGEAGIQGAPGIQGETGLDKHFFMPFTGALGGVLSVEHNLGKYPHVDVLDGVANRVSVDVRHVTQNLLEVRWVPANLPLTGSVVCN